MPYAVGTNSHCQNCTKVHKNSYTYSEIIWGTSLLPQIHFLPLCRRVCLCVWVCMSCVWVRFRFLCVRVYALARKWVGRGRKLLFSVCILSFCTLNRHVFVAGKGRGGGTHSKLKESQACPCSLRICEEPGRDNNNIWVVFAEFALRLLQSASG